jgi:hypothetical protein
VVGRWQCAYKSIPAHAACIIITCMIRLYPTPITLQRWLYVSMAVLGRQGVHLQLTAIRLCIATCIGSSHLTCEPYRNCI